MNNAVLFIQALINEIDEDLSATYQIEQIAQSLGVSQWHFQRLFKALTGWQLATYVMSRRINKVATLLMTSKQSLSDIALQTGFDHKKEMSLAFKQAFSCSVEGFRQFQPQFRAKHKAQITPENLRQLKLKADIKDQFQPKLVNYEATSLIGFDSLLPSLETDT